MKSFVSAARRTRTCNPTMVTSRCLAKKRERNQLSSPENRYTMIGAIRWRRSVRCVG